MARKNKDPQTKEVTTFGSATVAYVNFGLLIGAIGLGIYFTDKENRQQSALDQHYVRTYGHRTHLDKLRDEFNTSELSAAGYEPLWADDDNFINVYKRQARRQNSRQGNQQRAGGNRRRPTASVGGRTSCRCPTGPRGPPGAPGERGDTIIEGQVVGIPGVNGVRGQTGEKGFRGVTGAAGARGAQGTRGVPGRNGINGTPGSNGQPGTPGLNGAPGTIGADGNTGSPGVQGVAGPNGTPGRQELKAQLECLEPMEAQACLVRQVSMEFKDRQENQGLQE